jgi:RNA polymerase sigma factor (sigma-70 family)
VVRNIDSRPAGEGTSMTADLGQHDLRRAQDLARWMAEYGPSLRRYFRRRVSAADADDLVQDVFLALSARSAEAPIENVQGYLFAIASRLLSKHKPTRTLTLLDEAGALSDGFSPERLYISHQDVVRAVAAIRDLPPRAREAFILHRFENMTYAAIGRKLAISASAVGKLIARALAHITKALDAGE